MENQLVGSVIFSDPASYDPSGVNMGWRSVSGMEPVQIEGTADLPTNVKWLSNISIDVAYATRLRSSPRVLDDRYLRTAVNSLIVELGLKNIPSNEKALVIGDIFDRVYRFSKKFYGIEEMPQHSLAQGISGAIGHYQPDNMASVMEAAKSATQTYVQCERPIIEGKNVTFTSAILPRALHCENILSAGLPWGEFRPLSKVEMPQPAERVKWICSTDKPTIARVRISRINRKYNPLINYGAGSGTYRKNYNVANDRRYATGREIAFLSQVADFEIDEILISDEPVEQRNFLPDLTKLQELSYSAGLALENYWVSLARNQDGQWVRSPITAWLHAVDRELCLNKALRLHSEGYVVTGYGGGRINLAIEESQINDYLALCVELNLCPSMGVGSIGDDRLRFDDNPRPSQILSALFAKRDLKTIFRIDKDACKEVDARGERHGTGSQNTAVINDSSLS